MSTQKEGLALAFAVVVSLVIFILVTTGLTARQEKIEVNIFCITNDYDGADRIGKNWYCFRDDGDVVLVKKWTIQEEVLNE